MAAIEKFNDLQAARVVLNATELLRAHRDKMTGIIDDLPPLVAVEKLLQETLITDDFIIAELSALVKEAPEFAEAWLELGVAHFDRRNFSSAEICFAKCLSDPPVLNVAPDRTACHVQAALGKARILAAQGKLEAAAEAYALGLKEDSVSGHAHAEYGELLRRLDRVRESLAEFEAGMSSDITAVALPSMPRDFLELASRLKARFGGTELASSQTSANAKAAAQEAVPLADAPPSPPDKFDVRHRLRLRLVTVVWGTSFIDIYLRITARSLLSAGNLEALAKKFNISYSIHTTQEGARTLRASPIFRRIQEIVDVDIAVFDERVIDVKNPSSHWTLWRSAAEQAKRANETIFFIIPDMVFAVDTLARWGRLFEEGYRAVCMASLPVVLETTSTEMESRFPVDGTPISLTDAEIHDLLLRQLHPMAIGMYRDTSRPSRHSDLLLAEAAGAGLVTRVLALHPFCIDLNYFEVNNAFNPLDRLEDVAFEQPYTVCLEPLLKYPDLYFRKSQRSERRLSNMGSWIDYHLSPSEVLWAAHNSRFFAPGRSGERSFRRAETVLGNFVSQALLTGRIYRVMDAMRAAGCKTAAQVLSLAHFVGRLRRHWRIRGEITIVVPVGDGDMGLPHDQLERILMPGNEKLLRQAIYEHVFPGKLTFSIGDGLSRADGSGAPVASSNIGRRASGNGVAAEVIAGPIEIDDCTIYVIDRALSVLSSWQSWPAEQPAPSKASVLPNRWTMNPARMLAAPATNKSAADEARVKEDPTVVPEPPTALAALDTFLKSYFEEAGKEDASKAGGLNGHLSVARLLGLEPPLADGTAAVLVSMGGLFHRLHYFNEITNRYCDAIGLPQAEMPVVNLIESITKGQPPLQRARELYEAALLADPGSARARLNLAGVNTLEGATDAADRLYEEAVLRDPSLAGHAALRRAAIYEAAENWPEAAELYLQAASELQVLGEWHENAARCLRRCGRFDEALQQYYLALDWFRRPGIEFIAARPALTDADNRAGAKS